MKKLLVVGMLLLSVQTFASDKGNGGSGSESQLAGLQAQLEGVSQKLRSFFLKNEESLRPVFPEFNIQDLVKKIKNSEIRVVESDELIDKNGVSRTCLNFPSSSLIECKASALGPLFDQPSALFVLVLHEYLGLIGAEETSPANPTMISGYSISKRIAAYVTKVNDYDLVVPEKVAVNNVYVCSKEGSAIKKVIENTTDELSVREGIQRTEAALGKGHTCIYIFMDDAKKIQDSFSVEQSYNAKSSYVCSILGSTRIHLVNARSVKGARKKAAAALYESNKREGYRSWKISEDMASCIDLKGIVDLDLFRESIEPVLFKNE